ncbi:hypothetical protein, partial [Thiolapillus sp.]|uniref:hypothetical protein n=1 Tax=Thiolapillus sp. TaxID=2017437 RepID=UPI003AF834E4
RTSPNPARPDTHPDRKKRGRLLAGNSAPRLAGLRAWFEACTNLVAVWWQIGDAVSWETADDALKNIPSSSSAG